MAAALGKYRAAQGIGKIAPDLGFDLLQQFLNGADPEVSVLPVNWTVFRKQFATGSLPSILGEAQHGSHSDRRLLDELRRANPKKRRSLLITHIESQLRAVMGLSSACLLDPRQGLNSLGMDSLLAVEFGSRLQSSLECALPATMAFEHPTIEATADFLLSQILQFDAETPPALIPEPQPDIQTALVQEDELSAVASSPAEKSL